MRNTIVFCIHVFYSLCNANTLINQGAALELSANTKRKIVKGNTLLKEAQSNGWNGQIRRMCVWLL